MGKLIKIVSSFLFLFPVLNGCNGNPNMRGELNQRQRQFVSDMHYYYGEKVSYDEMRKYLKNRLGKYQADVVNHYLKKYCKEKNTCDDLDEKTLAAVYEATRGLD